MTRKQRHLLTRIIVAAVLFLAGSLLHLPELAEMAVFLVCYVVVGWDIVWKAITNILHGQVFDENFLMTIATIGALILGEHSEGVAVMLFYQVGEWIPVLCGVQVQKIYRKPDGHSPGLCQHRKGTESWFRLIRMRFRSEKPLL